MISLIRILFFSSCLLVAGLAARGQCLYRISGHITDADTREKLQSATILIKELNKTIVSDKDGYYQVEGLCPGNYDLLISHVGCASILFHIHLKADVHKDFELPHQSNQLTGVTVVGRGLNKGSSLSGELKGKDLEAVRGLSLGEALKQVNGVSVLQTGANIYKPVINGLHSNRVLILNNGIRQEGQQWGSEHAPEIDPYIANRLTVIKGAGAIRYGSDALGGVVLVEPRLLRNVPGIGGEMNLAAFSNNRQGVFSGILEGNSMRHPAFAWRLQATAKKGGNARTPGYWLDNSGNEEINFSATAGWRKADKGLEIFYSQFNTRLGIFSGSHIGNVTDLLFAINNSEPPDYIRNAGFSYTIDRPYQQVQHQLFKLKAFQSTGQYGRLNWVLAGQYNWRREYDKKRFQSSSNAPQLDLKIGTVNTDLVWDHFTWKRFRGSVGLTAAWQHNSYEQRLFIPNYQAFNTGIFWVEKWDKNNWQLEAGLRYDTRHIYQISRNNGSPYPRQDYKGFSGNIGFVKRISDHLQLSMNASTAWRAPQVNELFSDGLHHGAARIEKGDSLLRPERGNTVMAGLVYNDERWDIDLGFYHKEIGDFIFLKPSYPPQLTIRGAFPAFLYAQTNARLSGVDLSIGRRLSSHISLAAKASILRAYDKKAGDWLIQMPADRYEAELSYYFSDGKKWKQPFIKLNVQQVLQQTRVPATGLVEVPQPGGGVKMQSDYALPPNAYSLLGFEAGVSLQRRHLPLNFILSVTNLFNTAYRDYMNAFRYFSDDMGRNISLRASLPFEFSMKRKK